MVELKVPCLLSHLAASGGGTHIWNRSITNFTSKPGLYPQESCSQDIAGETGYCR